MLNCWFRLRSNRTSKLCVIGPCEGNSPVTDEIPAQRTSNGEDISIWCRHHDNRHYSNHSFQFFMELSSSLPPIILRPLLIHRSSHRCHVSSTFSRTCLSWRSSSSSIPLRLMTSVWQTNIIPLRIWLSTVPAAPIYAVFSSYWQTGHKLQRNVSSWWRHQMETFSALLALCAGNSAVTGEFTPQRPVTRSFDVFFGMGLNKRLSKQSRRWWFETPLRSLWRKCKVPPPSMSFVEMRLSQMIH